MADTPEPAHPHAVNDQDLLNHGAGITPGSPLAQLRAERKDVSDAAQRSYQALLEPDDPTGVSRDEREMIALRVAVLTSSPPLIAWHRGRLRTLGASDATIAAIEQLPTSAARSAQEQAILQYVDRLTLAPDTATAGHMKELQAAGLSPRDIVTMAQLIALLSFEVRVLAGLRLLGESE